MKWCPNTFLYCIQGKSQTWNSRYNFDILWRKFVFACCDAFLAKQTYRKGKQMIQNYQNVYVIFVKYSLLFHYIKKYNSKLNDMKFILTLLSLS